MKRTSLALVASVALFAVTDLAAAKEKKTTASSGHDAVMLTPDQLKWGDAPPALPKGAQVAVLQGDPFKKGVFAIRFKMPDGYKIPPHWHTNTEELTILSGTFMLGIGDNFDEASMHSLAPTSYHYLPGKKHHYAMATGETVVEIHGMGPFDIHYLNPADDPTKKSATK